MATVERRLQHLEAALLPRQRRNVTDPSELSNVELCLELLDGFDALNDPGLAALRTYICAKSRLVDECLTDPMERYAARLLRTVIWGGDCEWMTGPIDGALPLLAEQYRRRFPARVFDAAMRPPPWSD